eukprot:15159837-Ditylum_brightwellii.AAC.1
MEKQCNIAVTVVCRFIGKKVFYVFGSGWEVLNFQASAILREDINVFPAMHGKKLNKKCLDFWTHSICAV